MLWHGSFNLWPPSFLIALPFRLLTIGVGWGDFETSTSGPSFWCAMLPRFRVREAEYPTLIRLSMGYRLKAKYDTPRGFYCKWGFGSGNPKLILQES